MKDTQIIHTPIKQYAGFSPHRIDNYYYHLQMINKIDGVVLHNVINHFTVLIKFTFLSKTTTIVLGANW